MSLKSYNAFMIISMSSVIALSFILGSIFPSIPGIVYVLIAVLGGTAILVIKRRIAKQSSEVFTDERIKKHTDEASYITFRVTFTATILGGIILTAIASTNSTEILIGRVLLVLAVFQSILFTVIYQVKNRIN